MTKYFAEFTGTFGFVFIGCGAVIIAEPWIGFLGIAVAFGFALSAMMFAFTPVSGGHFNPAVTFALTLSGRFTEKTPLRTAGKFIGYILSQTLGAIAAAALLHFIYSGKTGYVNQGSFAANTIERYTVEAAFWLETILSFLFLCVFLGSNAEKNRKGIAPIAVGLALAAAYLISIPVTKGALNPVRSTAMALQVKGVALQQLWIFWGAPMLAALFAGFFYNKKIIRFLDRPLSTSE